MSAIVAADTNPARSVFENVERIALIDIPDALPLTKCEESP